MADNAAITEALDRIVASAGFVNSPRMSRFLRFVVEETAAGRAAGLKEYVVALRVFDKAESFDPAVDPTVRVEASKLRLKLARYYETAGRDETIVIQIPKGHYAARFLPAPRTPHTPTATWHKAALAVVVAAMVTAGGYAAWRATHGRPATTTARIMLAVLPFQNLTGDPDQEYLCDGLTEEMIAHLGGADPARLGVVARTSAMHYKGTTQRADEIGRELGVRYLLEASLRRVRDRVRITAQLIDVQSQDHVWVEQYERDSVDALTLQGEIAAAVERRIASSLGLTARRLNTSLEGPATTSPAYDHYLRGRFYWLKQTPANPQKALEHFQKAIALDPSYARAYSGLADVYALLGSYGILPMAETHPLARKAALTALELDPDLGEAHRSLAAIVSDRDWDWPEADRHYKRALALGPNDVTTLRFYSFYLAHTGRPLEALPIAEQACVLDPASVNARMNLGVVLRIAHRHDDSVRQFEEALELDENFGMARAMLGLAYASQGKLERAVAELEQARRLSGTRPDIIAFHAYTLGRAGQRREALTALDDLRRHAGPQGPSPFHVALVYTGLEDHDRAFEWLEKAFEARAWEMPLLKASPVFDGLRSDSRFAPLLKRVGLPGQ